jgi:hypothetical protein
MSGSSAVVGFLDHNYYYRLVVATQIPHDAELHKSHTLAEIPPLVGIEPALHSIV